MQLNVFYQSYQELRKGANRWTFILLLAAGLLLLTRRWLLMLLDLNWLGSQGLASVLFGVLSPETQLSRTWDWLQAMGFGLVFPLMLALYAINKGSWLVAGEEERGSLGMQLAAPLPRWRFMLEKSVALVVVISQPVVALWIMLIILQGLKITPVFGGGSGQAILGLLFLGLFFGALALALGCLTGRRKQSSSIAAGFLILFIILSRLPQNPPLFNSLRYVSPVTWYTTVLPGSPGENAVFLLALAALVLVSLVAAWIAFERRDLAV